MAVSVILSTFTRGLQFGLKFNKAPIRSLSKMETILDEIPTIDIDPNGVFKYILVFVNDEHTNLSKGIVRGYQKCKFHGDIYQTIIEEEIKKYGPRLTTDCVGGGSINHNAERKTIKVYGYSQGFGKAHHATTVELLKGTYPEYTITWIDDGY